MFQELSMGLSGLEVSCKAASAHSWYQGWLVPFTFWILAVLYCQATMTVGSAVEDAERGLASPGNQGPSSDTMP